MSDFGFLSRLRNFYLDGRAHAQLQLIMSEDPDGQARELAEVSDGVVITGGGRPPWYGCLRCALTLERFQPGPAWRLVTTLEGPLGPYRKEPLRIWRVSAAAQRADALLKEVLPETARAALLGRLAEAGDWALAVEVGRRLVGWRPRSSRLQARAGERRADATCARASVDERRASGAASCGSQRLQVKLRNLGESACEGCRSTTVSGFTISSRLAEVAHVLRSATQKAGSTSRSLGLYLPGPSAAPPQPKVHDATRGEGGAALSSVGSLQRLPRPSLPRAPPTSSSCWPRPREIVRAARRFSEAVDQRGDLLPEGEALEH